MNSVRKITKKRIGRSKKTKKVQRGGFPKLGNFFRTKNKQPKITSVPPASGLGIKAPALAQAPAPAPAPAPAQAPAQAQAPKLVTNLLYESAGPPRSNKVPLPVGAIQKQLNMTHLGEWFNKGVLDELSENLKSTLNNLGKKDQLSTLKKALKTISSNDVMEKNKHTGRKTLRDFNDQSEETKKKIETIANILNVPPEKINDLFAFGKTNLLSKITEKLNAHYYEPPKGLYSLFNGTGTRHGSLKSNYLNVSPSPRNNPNNTYLTVRPTDAESKYLTVGPSPIKNPNNTYFNVRPADAESNYLNVGPARAADAGYMAVKGKGHPHRDAGYIIPGARSPNNTYMEVNLPDADQYLNIG